MAVGCLGSRRRSRTERVLPGVSEPRAGVVTNPANTFFEHKITNLFTVGPRLGYAWDRFMIFATGGYASADLKTAACSTVTGLCDQTSLAISTVQSRNSGWYAGGGFDYMVHKGPLVDVLLGLEYQHFDVGSKNAFCFNPGCNPGHRMGRGPERQGRHRARPPDHQDSGLRVLLPLIGFRKPNTQGPRAIARGLFRCARARDKSRNAHRPAAQQRPSDHDPESCETFRTRSGKAMPGRARFHISDCDLAAMRIHRLRSRPPMLLWPNIESVPSLRICHSQSDWNLIKKHNLIPNGGFK